MFKRTENKEKDTPNVDPNLKIIREDWIAKQLRIRKKEFTQTNNILVFCGTWNVNAKKPSEDLGPWLIDSQYPQGADIYALGWQEIVNLNNATNLVVDNTASKAWDESARRTLGDDYVKICSLHLVGIALIVYVKNIHVSYISEVESCSVGVGLLGVAGNKGGLAIRLKFMDSTLCFINSHLAAHTSHVKERNSDFQSICERVSFVLDKSQPEASIGMEDHDLQFWLGDLNYRLTLTDNAAVHEKIQAQDWPFLLQHDQLIIEKEANNTFQGWTEAKINFAPTYKYKTGTKNYSTGGKKERVPAWCDRVQWKAEGTVVKHYRRAELLQSDHKPVSALLEVPIAKILKPEMHKVRMGLIRLLDSWENETLPKVRLSTLALKFDDVHFNRPMSRTFQVENVGQSVAQFSVANSTPWVKVQPQLGIIPPGEPLDIKVTVHFSRDTAMAVNVAPMDAILIFKLKDGRDYFVTVAGTYERSVLGASIPWLVNIPTPVRVSVAKGESPLQVPKELWRMADYLYKNGLNQPQLFGGLGSQEDVDLIFESLDTGAEFPQVSVHSMADAFLWFLQQTAEPVLPLIEKFADGPKTPWCRRALLMLPPAQLRVLLYVLSFLREMCHHGQTSVQLTQVFTPALTHTSQSRALQLIQHLLESPDF